MKVGLMIQWVWFMADRFRSFLFLYGQADAGGL